MPPNSALALLCAVLVGALARDLVVPSVSAEDDVIRRSDVTTILRALEKLADAANKQAEATKDVAREVRDAGRNGK